MPWKVLRNYKSCRGYAVVKDSSMEIVGCHETMDGAQSQIRALYASEGEMKSTGFGGASAGTVTNQITPNKNPQPIKEKEKEKKIKKYDLGDGQVFYDNLPDDEQKLADALLNLVAEIGYLDEAEGIYVGYVDGSQNDNLGMNIKCGTCALHVTDNKCSILKQQIEENGLCRFAVIPYEYANSLIQNSEGENNMNKAKYSEAQRRRMAGTGAAMDDGSFPIADREDLENAISSVGRAKNYSLARAHIVRRANSLGMRDMLPEDWKVSGQSGIAVEEFVGSLSGRL